MSVARLRVALIGYGGAGRVFHAPLIRHTAGLELALVASSRGDELARALPGVEVVATPQHALSRDDIDLVVIASPNPTHAALAEAALRAGRHVVVDKPFTLTLAEARGLARLAAQRDRVLAVFHNRRWDNDFLALREVLASGQIGRLTWLESRFDRFRPHVQDRWRERADDGGGIWLDLGPHLVDQALQLFGLPARVGGRLSRQRDGAAADDGCEAWLDYEGLRVSLSASMLVGGGLPRFAAHGTAGSWIRHGLDVQEDQLKAGLVPGDTEWGEDARPACLYRGDGEILDLPVPRGRYEAFYAAVRDAMLGCGANPVPPAQAVATMAVLETVAEAARLGRMLPVPLDAAERTAFAG
ncbi:oxidoreductase [Thauera sp. WH-1]|uniref:oxidoreductase n=1 Tax=Thauera sp. WH-1 TaxID=3398230 RepID=UPI0039FBDBA6